MPIARGPGVVYALGFQGFGPVLRVKLPENVPLFEKKSKILNIVSVLGNLGLPTA
jgi:hypothetical protein